MRGAIPPLAKYDYVAWCSVKSQGQFYLYLTLQCMQGQLLEGSFRTLHSHPLPLTLFSCAEDDHAISSAQL